MAIYEFEGKRPQIPDSSYVHESAIVTGDVTLGEECFIGAGAVLRGDYGSIIVGDRTSIQENSVVHARDGDYCRIGSDVQVGHGSILHNCKISDFAVIGLGSRICDFSTVGVWTIVGEGSVVVSKSTIPDGKVAVGTPARVIRDVSEEDKKTWSFYKQKYAELCQRY
ncbi:MAG: gamma carbonic anhydrase family protein, partial [Thaumarchaeota archaeon]|nr:gamma carbonic anhydrase family protein [Nitrososphaerota archaeon]